jgi:hypothetical protein
MCRCRAPWGGMETQSPYPYGIEGEGSPLAPKIHVSVSVRCLTRIVGIRGSLETTP